MNKGLPPRLAFLWKLLLEANLLQARRAVARGIQADIALATVGLTGEHLHHIARHARNNRSVRDLLESARTLIASGRALP